MGRSQTVVPAAEILQEAQDKGHLSFRPILDRYRESEDHWVDPPADRSEAVRLSYATPWNPTEILRAFTPELTRDQEAQ